MDWCEVMASKNIINLDKGTLKLDKNILNKQIFYPVIKAGYDIAKRESLSHKKTGELFDNTKVVSLTKHGNELGYLLVAGKRSSYSTPRSPHFLFYYTYKRGRIYRKIKRAIAQQVRSVNGK